MKSSIALLASLFVFAVLFTESSAEFDWDEWKADFQKSMDDLKEKLKAQAEEANAKLVASTEEVWAGYGSILLVDSTGGIVSASLDSRRVGADVPDAAYDLTEMMAVHSCKTVTLPKYSIQTTVCGAPNQCKSLTTHRSMATVCPGSISTSQTSGGLTMIRDGGHFGPNGMSNVSILGGGSSVINGSIFGK